MSGSGAYAPCSFLFLVCAPCSFWSLTAPPCPKMGLPSMRRALFCFSLARRAHSGGSRRLPAQKRASRLRAVLFFASRLRAVPILAPFGRGTSLPFRRRGHRHQHDPRHQNQLYFGSSRARARFCSRLGAVLILEPPGRPATPKTHMRSAA